MGDRTYCSLTFWKVTNTAEYESLMKTIILFLGQPEFHSGLPNELGFDEVNYANLPGTIQENLRYREFSYTWEWGNGGNYSAGVELYDAETKGSYQFNKDDYGYVVSMDIAKNPEALAEAIKWEAWGIKPKIFSALDAPDNDFLIKLVTEKQEDVS